MFLFCSQRKCKGFVAHSHIYLRASAGCNKSKCASMWENILFSCPLDLIHTCTHTHTQRKTYSLLLHVRRTKKNTGCCPSMHRQTQHNIQKSLLHTHTHTHNTQLSPKVLMKLMQCTQNDFLWQHTQIQIKRKLNASAHGQKQRLLVFFWSLDMKTLYLCLSDRVVIHLCLCLIVISAGLSTGKHSWASALLPITALGLILSVWHVYLSSPPLSLATMMIFYCKIKENKSENQFMLFH